MNLNSLVSVIIPTYNREKYIKEAIESVLNQTYKYVEVIIIDDGSTDNTKKIIDEINKRNNNIIKYYYQENSGVARARNYGIEVSTGDYIAFLDSDDFWDLDKLQKQMNKINMSKVECCYCGTYKYYHQNSKKRKIKNSFKEGKVLIDILRGYINSETISWVINKEILITHNLYFTENCDFSEDLEFYLKLSSISNVCCVNEFLCYYRMHNESLVRNTVKQHQEIEMYDRFLRWFNKNNLLNYNPVQVESVIFRYRIPSAILRTIFESIEANPNYKKEYLSNIDKIRKLDLNMGAGKLRILFYKFCIRSALFYNAVKFARRVKYSYYR